MLRAGALLALGLVSGAVALGVGGEAHAEPGGPGETRAFPALDRDSVVRAALKYLGVRYLWGGASPAGFDCSGLVRHVYAKIGVSMPHSARQQYQYGSVVPRDDLEPGDVVFFDRLRHNGIYIGHGRFVHAGKHGGAVTVSRLDEPWFKRRWVGGRRLFRDLVASAGASPSADSTGP